LAHFGIWKLILVELILFIYKIYLFSLKPMHLLFLFIYPLLNLVDKAKSIWGVVVEKIER
jgi:hypothetical protein